MCTGSQTQLLHRGLMDGLQVGPLQQAVKHFSLLCGVGQCGLKVKSIAEAF